MESWFAGSFLFCCLSERGGHSRVVAHDPTSSCTAVPSTIDSAVRQHCGDAEGLLEILRKDYGP